MTDGHTRVMYRTTMAISMMVILEVEFLCMDGLACGLLTLCVV